MTYPGELSYRQIMVGQFMTGLVGLDEMFAELYAEGRAPEPALGDELVRRAAAHNYIAPGSEREFAEALLREYRRYWEQQTGQIEARPARQAPQTWHGWPRRQVSWYPTIYPGRCDGCGDCLKFCEYGVFDFDAAGEKVVVVDPFNCIVGCEACAKICKLQAITFPPRTVLKTFES